MPATFISGLPGGPELQGIQNKNCLISTSSDKFLSGIKRMLIRKVVRYTNQGSFYYSVKVQTSQAALYILGRLCGSSGSHGKNLN